MERSGTAHANRSRKRSGRAVPQGICRSVFVVRLLGWHEPLQLVAEIADEEPGGKRFPVFRNASSPATRQNPAPPQYEGQIQYVELWRAVAKRIGTPFAASCARLRRPVVVTRASQTRPRARRVSCTLSGGIAGVVPLLSNSFTSDSRTASHMNTNTLLIILVLVLLFGGGGFYFRGRR